MSRGKRIILYLALLAGVAAAVAIGFRRGAESFRPYTEAHRPAATYPDYRDIVIPHNLAPLNLKVLESGRRFCMRLSAGTGAPVELFSTDGSMQIPAGEWRKLLEANSGGELRMDLYAKREGGWVHFETVRNRIAAEGIDPYVVYRYIPPIYNKWDQISLRQRDLRNFEELILFDNQRSTDREGNSVGSACINCHTFLNHGTSQMLLHMRPARAPHIPAMILVRDGRAEKVDTRDGPNAPATYISWHPSGKLLTFSRNRLTQLFHTAGVETREVVDRDSDLGLYRLDTGQVFTVPQISRPDRLETFPAWSPDGRHLYFASARLWADQKNAPLMYQEVRYDLERISYDIATERWGPVETVVAAAKLGKSISLPQISPDGRFLMFCGHDYGSFPVFQPSSDLYIVDLGQPIAAPRRLDEINSDRTDSYHSWSTNGRWVIFSSKREDGMFARLYITHLGADGRFSKPFVMPQQDPEFYGRCLMTYNRPELIAEPVTVSATELTRAMNSTASRPPGAAAPSAAGAPGPTDSPWQPLK
jgi:dipeptidyl aminopeptidase/acylaminoacyl peptidase